MFNSRALACSIGAAVLFASVIAAAGPNRLQQGYVGPPKLEAKAEGPAYTGSAYTDPYTQRAPAPDRFAEIFDRGVAKQKEMTSIEAAFTETTTNSLLKVPLVAHGTVTAAAPGRMRMTYTDGDRHTLYMDGKSLVIVWADRPDRQTINVSDVQKNVNHYFTTASLKDLRSMFQIKTAPDAARPHIDRVEMQPTEKHIKDGLKLLEIWIDRQTDLMTQMRLSFPSGDSKTLALDQIRVNVPVTDAMFTPPR